MADNNEFSIKGKIKAEINKIKEMDSKKRLSYLKAYYLGPLIGILFIIICLIWFLSDTVFNRMTPIYSGGMVNCNIDEEKLKNMNSEFFEILGGNPKKEEVVITNDFFLTFAEEEQESAVQMDMSLYTLIAAGEFDFLFLDKEAAIKFQGTDTFKDVSRLVDGLEISEEEFYYNESGVPTAIRLPDEVLNKYKLTGYDGEVYIVFIDLGRHDEKDVTFLKYLYSK